MIDTWVLFAIIPSVVAIAYIDYILFRKWTRCQKCGAEGKWHDFILPTLLEISFFLAGIAIGIMLEAPR